MTSIWASLVGAVSAIAIAGLGLWQSLKKDGRSARAEAETNTLSRIEAAWRMQDENIDWLKKELGELRTRYGDCEEQIRELQGNITKLQAENDQLKAENKELRRRVDLGEEGGAPHA